jgi:hypothetical protein
MLTAYLDSQRAFRERQAGHAKDSEKRLAELERTSTSLSEETESLKREVANLSNENEVTKSSSAQSSGNVNRTRKWRRHPRPDDHAPDRPPSAYVIFSNIVREELKDQDLSFTKIARTVGERWQALTSDQRRPFEDQACGAKERYLEELANYKETEEYKDYQKYLWDFNARFSTNTASKTSASSILVEETSGSTIYSVPSAPTPRISAMSISACPSLVEDSSDKSWSTRSSASESSPHQPSALPPGFTTPILARIPEKHNMKIAFSGSSQEDFCSDNPEQNDQMSCDHEAAALHQDSQSEFESEDSISSAGTIPSVTTVSNQQLIASLMKEFYLLVNYNTSSPGQQQSSIDSRSRSAASSSQIRGTNATDPIIGKKWQLNEGDDHSDDEKQRRPKKAKSSSSQGNYELLACPFYKYNPLKYACNSETRTRYRPCSGPGWESIARLKYVYSSLAKSHCLQTHILLCVYSLIDVVDSI